MGNKVQSEMDKIEIPAELHQRSKQGVLKAKAEMSGKQSFRLKGIAALAASLLVLVGSYSVYTNHFQNEVQESEPIHDSPILNEEGIFIPSIELPEKTDGTEMDMIGLIVYNGKIYTQTDTKIEPDQAKALLGEKLGRTKGSIDEWSSQDDYAVEFASSIGEMDVYAVQGYDKDFRIIAFEERQGEVFAEFYECLNGITIQDGEDIFGKLKIAGNVVSAQYRNFSDWDNGINQYYPIENEEVLNAFVEELNNAVPYSYQKVEPTLGDYRNDEAYKRLNLILADGSQVDLVVIKDGYVRYGFTDVYFKMEDEIFTKMWEQMN
ncbi:hypothetical protein SAMN05877753_11022 [Bacillus oleivorans]|uniref:Uncharacterized protein n=1 Tax=Bacillus oleivorans TaxID=1448271 RepID=A0A285D4F0_9BACI|nr:hypothetical protein [Bacillus oleivorans]SNX74701.1 hypothetical protein SAMN05877753_11022 [Bacillus oleivorans]